MDSSDFEKKKKLCLNKASTLPEQGAIALPEQGISIVRALPHCLNKASALPNTTCPTLIGGGRADGMGVGGKTGGGVGL